MGARFIRGAWLLVAVLALVPGMVQAQGSAGYAPPPWSSPVPLGSTRPENGGLYLDAIFNAYLISNPLKNQTIARSGFRLFDESLGLPAGTFIGPGDERLNVQQNRDDMRWQPGWSMGIGWKFSDGSALSLNWLYVSDFNYSAGATLAPEGGFTGPAMTRTYLTYDVFNLPLEYSGPPNKIQAGSPFALFGLWNGASIMTTEFTQRFQQWEITYRWPVYETEDTRLSGLVGPRFAWLWQKFLWRTVNFDANGGGGGPLDTGIYTNIASNRMYGVHCGTQWESYIGNGFACISECQAALLLNSVKQRAKYETGDKYGGTPASKYARRQFSLVPELQASIGLSWHPWFAENVEIMGLYQGMIFFNTLQSGRPVHPDYLRPKPQWESTILWLHGFQFGAAIHF